MLPTFAQLGVSDSMCRALAARGITQPFEIQTAALADALDGRDICGRAPTGSGKTLAFGIPLVANVDRAGPRRPKALVLAPTRELADQIMTELRSFSGPVRVAVVYGGVGYGAQLDSLRRGVDILVACPGRLEDLIDQRAVSLSEVEMVVIDEADRMADMGFIPAVRRLLDQTAPQPQTMLFSATLDGDVATLTRDYQYEPVRCEVGEETPDVVAADHVFWRVARTDRIEVAAGTISAAGPSIVFCRTRHGSDRLARQLDRSGIRTAAIHGGRSQNQRTRALKDFMTGRVEALIATDVAARGIHVEGVSAVIHYDPPEDHKAYLHRSGRTARAGQGGMVVSFVQPEQVKELGRMQRQIDLQQPITDVDMGVIQRLAPSAAARSDDHSSTTDSSRQHQDTQSRGGESKRKSDQSRRGESKRKSDQSRRGESQPRGEQRRGESQSRGEQRRGESQQPRSSRSGRPPRSRNRGRRPQAKRAA